MAAEGLRKGYGSGLQAGTVSELSNQLEQINLRNKLFKKINFALVVVVAGLAIFSFYYFVWRFAVVDDIKITQDEKEPTTVWYDFKVIQGGILQWGRENSVVSEPVPTGEKRRFRYKRPGLGKKEFSVYLRSRSGPFPSWTSKTFLVSGGG
jgi:hypothetical protein